MKKNLIILATFVFSALAINAQTDKINLSLAARGYYYPLYIYGVNPLQDGESYSQMSDEGNQVIRRSFKTGEILDTLYNGNTVRGGDDLITVDGYVMSPDGRRMLIYGNSERIYRHSFKADYYIFDIQNNRMVPLSSGGKQQQAKFSPDGTMVAFVRDGNLFLVKLLFQNAESQITKDGEFNKVINGLPDWVNEEEFSTACSFDFSADSKMLAWVRYDESAVPLYSMAMYKGLSPEETQNDEYPGSYNYKYPVAGAANSKVSVLTFDIKDRVTKVMDIPMDSDTYVPRIKFTSDPERLAVVTLDRDQHNLNIFMANPRSGICKLAVHEQSDKYITESAYNDMQFYDNCFAYVSDRSGYKHIYLYNLNGQLLRQATNGKFDVCNLYGYDAKADRFYYQAFDESPLRKAVYSVDKKGVVKKLSQQEGTNVATFSTNMKYYLNVYSSAIQPPITTLNDGNSGKAFKTLVDNKILKERAEKVVGRKQFFSFTTSEGVELNGWMIKPRNFDATKKYPVVMYQYSGPGSQEVKDAWNMGMMPGGIFESYLAQKGFIAVCVDGRGTGGRGADFEKCTYLNLGDLESKDQVEAALYLGTLPFVDKDRIGIWGWSFGGFNTLMSMSEGRPVFRAGVAVAAPTNWKYYDTVYTERYMLTPRQNVAGYNRNPIQRVDKLHGDLLLIHGSADDNVHLRNFMEYSEALVQAEIDFDQQIYTNRNHSIYGGETRGHLFNKIVKFFCEKLQVAK